MEKPPSLTPKEWLKVYEEVAKSEGFNEDQVAEYRRYFDFLIAMGPVGIEKMTAKDIKEAEERQAKFEAEMKAAAAARAVPAQEVA